MAAGRLPDSDHQHETCRGGKKKKKKEHLPKSSCNFWIMCAMTADLPDSFLKLLTPLLLNPYCEGIFFFFYTFREVNREKAEYLGGNLQDM